MGGTPQTSEMTSSIVQNPYLPEAKQFVIFTVLILLVNIASLLIILTSRVLKKMLKFHIMASISVVHIISCLIYFPRKIHFILRYQADPSVSGSNSNFSALIETMDLFVLPSVISLSIVAMGMDFILNRNEAVDLRSKRITSTLAVCLPYLYGLIACVPCINQGLGLHSSSPSSLSSVSSTASTRSSQKNVLQFLSAVLKENSRNHSSSIQPHIIDTSAYKNHTNINAALFPMHLYSFISMTLIWILLPFSLLLLVSSSACILQLVSPSPSVMYTRRESQIVGGMPMDEFQDDLRPKYLIDIIFSSIILIACYGPTIVDFVSVLRCSESAYCTFARRVHHDYLLVKWTASFALAAVWMTDDRFREASAKACGRMFSKSCVVY